jgi:putative redox protein
MRSLPSTITGQAFATETGEQRYALDISAGGHHLKADEPKDAGGADTGPSPYDLLLASLGACTTITLRMYADRKQWNVTNIQVRLSHQKIHASDCAECQHKEGKIDHITRVIEIEGELSSEQRTRMLEIANKCPVHQTLTSATHITSMLAHS